MFIELPRHRKSTRGGTLVDYVMSMALGTLLISAVCAFSFHSSRSFATFYNMMDTDQSNSRTINQMVKDLRMVQAVTAFSVTNITMLDYNNAVLSYSYSPAARTLIRVSGAKTNTLLSQCGRLEFLIQQRNMTNDTFDFFTTTNASECKAITMNWACNRTLFGKTNEDLPQKLTVVIRN